ncbi:hypothetical protein CROQUDRAFT_651121 [Cronartium quercuum f. sp. fusiforme G11]|uniref:Inositol-pentakisphosphate 2-kinase n=1 Tax=Cronartium quercuum f. sp. fusiforme G11 TaxID=708437 RepID=A0A9P6NSB4_9BASI|nr:hypothetical protein CROQUDRAFT_651121 [Cronartium quercuum f. sp. fusiforme G11]
MNETTISQIPSIDPVGVTEPSAWRYVAEGAANLVVAYDPDLDRKMCQETSLKEKVLRLKKRDIDHELEHGVRSELELAANGRTKTQHDDQAQTRPPTIEKDAFVEFHHRILVHLFEPTHLLGFVSVRLQSDWLRTLGLAIQSSRPSFQQARSGIDVRSSTGMLMENLIGSGVDRHMAFEFKPKWTFLPQSIDDLKPENRQIKSKYCRTCIYRAVRSISTEAIKAKAQLLPNEQLSAYYTSKSRFCPLMISGSSDLRTVRDGVGRLHREWMSVKSESSGILSAPSDHQPIQVHNSFRVFSNGTIVGPEDSELDEQTLDLLARGIYQSSGLKRLDELQRLLDPIDLDGISNLLSNHSTDAQLDPPIDLSELESLIPLLNRSKANVDYREAFEKLSVRQKVVMYMLSMTMKDCSVFVRLPKTTENGSSNSSIEVETTPQGVDIKLIDLDLKPLSRLKKYIARDAGFLSQFKQLLDSMVEPVPCIELSL